MKAIRHSRESGNSASFSGRRRGMTACAENRPIGSRSVRSFLLASALASPASGAAAAADPLLDPMFADHALVQRDRPIAVWGKAAPGETVAVSLGARRASTKAGA